MSIMDTASAPAADDDDPYRAADDGSAPRRYVLPMFAYPSGDLHMGHGEAYPVGDLIARYLRLRGFDVLHPPGWDAFGLPAENAARRRGRHPAEWTHANIATQAESFRRYGIGFDWSRRLVTCEPDFYRWNQWLFLRMYRRGLAYRAPAPVNWCGSCATVLANEQVVDNRCDHCGSLVVERRLTQWFFRITAYADRLLSDMDALTDWPARVLRMQRNWIGREVDADGRVRYRLRDWLISRQRYWGTPIPIIHCARCGIVPVPDDQLPVTLPELPTGPVPGAPLTAATAWRRVACPRCAGAAEREADTMDTFVDSSWYFLRFCSPRYADGPFDPAAVRRWGPVDHYVGGVEHATGHLLFARFVTKVLHDLGLVPFTEPFRHLINQGQVVNHGRAMSKSLGNGVSLGAEIDRYGADAVRVTMLFAGPPEADIDWADVAPAGAVRFLARATACARRAGCPPGTDPAGGDVSLRRATHRTVAAVTAAIDATRYNVAIARLMELVGTLRAAEPGDPATREAAEALAVLLSVAAPHTAQEMWRCLGRTGSVATAGWPVVQAELAAADTVPCVVQVAGRRRAVLTVPADADEATLRAEALADSRVRAALGARPVARVVVRPPRIVSVVPGGQE